VSLRKFIARPHVNNVGTIANLFPTETRAVVLVIFIVAPFLGLALRFALSDLLF
jgi:hypothetical protein